MSGPKRLRSPDWLGHIYLNLAWALDSADFAVVAEQYFAKSRRWAGGRS